MLDTEPSRSAPAAAPLSRVRSRLARSPAARRWHARLQTTVRRFRSPSARGSFWDLSTEQAVRIAYNVMLRREPDATGRADFEHRISAGRLNREHMIEEMRGSGEYLFDVRFTLLGYSIQTSRAAFIQGLPRAARILDLGGTHKYHEHGALVRMGYPYPFERLVIVDLPDDDRHPIYQGDLVSGHALAEPEIETPLGPVSYRYHSMTDLSAYADESFDLVYMGQSIEHVTEYDADQVLAAVHRVLAPGGLLALDTPNGRVTRLQQEELIDPDHEIEYTLEEMTSKLEKQGFAILEAKGLNYAGPSLDARGFSVAAAAANSGVFADARNCYLLAFLCSRQTD